VTRIITLVTAVHAPSAGYLPDAYESLKSQKLPADWDWQWIIREDGETKDVVPYVPADERVVFEQGRPGGPGVARTLALANAAGEYVRVLDSDDMLTPGALTRDIAALDQNPDIGWTTSRILDLLPDGSTAGFDQDPPQGPIEKGEVLEHWRTHGHIAQVHPVSLCVRRDLLIALGGWMALPASEDTGLLLSLNAVSRGWFTRDEPGLLYRKWPGQATAQPSHAAADEREARMALVDARARHLMWLNWQWPPG
jgi:hypothetical protein